MQKNDKFIDSLKQIAIKNGLDLNLLVGSRAEEISRLCFAVAQEARQVVRSRYMGDNNREDMEVRRVEQALVERFGLAPAQSVLPRAPRSGRSRSPD